MYNLEKIQKRASRVIIDNYYDYNIRSADLFAELKWLPLNARINFNIAIQVYKCINGLSTQGLENLFTYSKNIHTHNTRSASKMNLHSNQHYYKSFSSIGITVWNKIPVEICSANSLSEFKECLFSYYCTNKSQYIGNEYLYMCAYVCMCIYFVFIHNLIWYVIYVKPSIVEFIICVG